MSLTLFMGRIVIHSFTPSGVEHKKTIETITNDYSDSFVYAVRR